MPQESDTGQGERPRRLLLKPSIVIAIAAFVSAVAVVELVLSHWGGESITCSHGASVPAS